MKKIVFTIYCTFFCIILHAQQVNVKDFGAKGDGKNDDLPAGIAPLPMHLVFPSIKLQK